MSAWRHLHASQAPAGLKGRGPCLYWRREHTGCPHGADENVPALTSSSGIAPLLAASIAVIAPSASLPATLRVVRMGVRVMGGIMGSLPGKRMTELLTA